MINGFKNKLTIHLAKYFFMKNHLLLVFSVLLMALNANANNINKPISSQYGFIENKGQIIDQNNNPNPNVFYLYNGNGLRVQLRKEGFSYEVINTIKTPKTIIDKAPHGKFASQADSFDITYQTHRVDINFKDGNKNATLKPFQTANDFINYYTTGTSEAGVTNVHHYQKIVYENVYPNIDIEFVLNDAANKGKFKYNFIVKPNGNLADIKLAFLGANRTSLNEAGNILIETAYGNIEENIPLSYVINNNNSHSTIKANFITLDNNIYGIKAENYNHNQTLVIDPTHWATFYGGSANDYGNKIATDKAGNIIIIGYTNSTNSIATTGSHQSIKIGNDDAFAAKFNNNGTILWATYYGGSGGDYGNGITTDSIGNIIITGYTTSPNSIATTGSHKTTNDGSHDAFIAKFNTNGTRLWGTYYGGSGNDYGNGITTDAIGNIMITGYTSSTSAIATIGVHQSVFGGNDDTFIAKFNTNGVRQWATYYGGSGVDIGKGIVIDSIGNIIIIGYTGSINAIATSGAHQTTIGGSNDAFIAKFNNGGNFNYVEKNIIKSAQTIFAGAVPNAIIDSITTTNIVSILYRWIRSDVDSINGYYSIVGTSATYSSPALTNTAWFKRVIFDGSSLYDTSNAIQITVDKTNTWIGITSNAWGVASNWSGNVVPVFTSNVFINNGAPNMPLISDGGRVCNNITIANGAVLTINNTNSNLSIYGSFVNNGLFSNTNGRVNFSGSNSQIIPSENYARLGINNVAGVSSSGNINITDSLVFANGCLSIGDYNLTMMGTNSRITGVNSSKFIVTNGTGFLKFQNIGALARTTTILFPIGTGASSYTPLSFLNSGTSDTFSVRVINGIYQSYSGTSPIGSSTSAFAVNRTWFINEGIVGGSNANVTLQWGPNEELPAMDNTSCYVSFYNTLGWNPSTSAAATGTNPYTRIGDSLTTFSNTAFGIGSNGTLPIKLISFNATLANEKVNCTWETASETNNDYFTIERSKDGKSFEGLGNIKGQGNSNSNIRYSYTDNNPFFGISYYRLKQTDFDGKYTYSPIKKVGSTEKLATEISLYYENENPIVKINSLVESNAKIELINLNGIKLFTNEQPIIKGENTFTLDGNRTKGLYLLKVQVEGEVKYFKVWLR